MLDKKNAGSANKAQSKADFLKEIAALKDEVARAHRQIEKLQGSGRSGNGERDQEAVRASEKRLLEAVDSLPASFHLWDADERLVMTNRIQLEWLPEIADIMVPGLPMEELIRQMVERKLTDVKPGKEKEYVRDRLAFFRGLTTMVEEVRKSGGRWLQARHIRLPDGSLVSVRVDISDAKRNDEHFRQVQKMEAIGQLTGGLAHDFNNILGIVIGNLEILQRMLAHDRRASDRIEAAIDGATRGVDLTGHLLEFSRQQSQDAEIVNANNSIVDMRELLARPLTPAIDIRLRPAEVLWPVRMDRGEFENALLNLVLNGRDAMAGGGVLTIDTANRTVLAGDRDAPADIEPGDYAVVTVSDTGAGMDEDVLDKIFEPFFSTKTATQATGLGLSMVYGFVQRSGGYIRVRSELSKGSSVQLFLPRAEGRSINLDKFEDDVGLLVGGNETILVVDDESLLRNVAATYLRELGYQVLEAANGAEALDMLYDYPAIDLMFCDIVMPGGIDGYDLARRALEDRADLKIVFTSGFARNDDSLSLADQAIKEAVTHHLHKPYVRSELVRTVRMALGPTALNNP